MTPTPADIQQARLSKNLTQARCAELLSTTVRTYRRWETGESQMKQPIWETFVRKLEEL